MNNFKEKTDLIWRVANLLRGDYKQSEYGKVILPMTVLRRLDCILKPTKDKVLKKLSEVGDLHEEAKDLILNRVAGYNFHNRSKYDFDKLIADPENIAINLRDYINGFSANVREILSYFNFDDQIDRLDNPKTDLLFLVVKAFQEIDLSDDEPLMMGYIFEDLIRRFAEQSNETAGEHFTPREVIRLMVNLLFIEDRQILTKKGIIKTMYDPACGTGGMLSVSEQYLKELNPKAKLEVFGQEINPESYAICKADMLIKGQDPSNIKYGDTFTQDGLPDQKFDYMLSNPPFGVDWKKAQKQIKDEYEKLGYAGRFGAGLPRINDGSLLFLQHMISKMKKHTRIGIVFNGSPLFTGQAGSGESNIRKWIIENDWLEAIIALPDQLFYNTPISTYIWIITNHKKPERRGKIQLINATGKKDEELVNEGKLPFNRFWEKMTKSLGQKRKKIAENGEEKGIRFITKLYGDFKENEFVKIFPNEFFGYWRIVVEQPNMLELWGKVTDNKEALIDFLDNATPEDIEKRKNAFADELRQNLLNGKWKTEENILILENGKKIKMKPETSLRDYENIPFLRIEKKDGKTLLKKQSIDEYFNREVKPHLPWAWIDRKKTKTGYEINFTKYFYEFKPLRSLEEIRADILALEEKTLEAVKKILNE